jgi:tetratricopeptide (TPR) repeat protein
MRLLALTILIAAAAAAALLGGVVRETRSAPQAAPAVAPAERASLASGYGGGDAEALVERLGAATRARPNDAASHAVLGLVLAQRARETGAARFYTRAEEALRAALALDANNSEATLGLGSVALSRHRFGEALALGERARRLAPGSAAPLGIVGDALLELGRYPRAFATFDRMVSLKPSVSSYARIAYARELTGDTAGAIDVMTLAVDAAGTGPSESGAFARTQLAHLILPKRPAEAELIYREALLLRPAYAPALIGLGHAEEAQGNFALALALFEQALTAAPSPDAAIARGDLLRRLHREREANRSYAQARALEEDFARHGGRNELELAMLDLDRDRNVRASLRRARIGHAARPSIEGEHVLAWALYKNGRCTDARRHSIRHLRLGTPDTDGLYHRVLIERCLGNEAAAEPFLRRIRSVEPGYLSSPPSAFRLGSRRARRVPPPALTPAASRLPAEEMPSVR